MRGNSKSKHVTKSKNRTPIIVMLKSLGLLFCPILGATAQTDHFTDMPIVTAHTLSYREDGAYYCEVRDAAAAGVIGIEIVSTEPTAAGFRAGLKKYAEDNHFDFAAVRSGINNSIKKLGGDLDQFEAACVKSWHGPQRPQQQTMGDGIHNYTEGYFVPLSQTSSGAPSSIADAPQKGGVEIGRHSSDSALQAATSVAPITTRSTSSQQNSNPFALPKPPQAQYLPGERQCVVVTPVHGVLYVPAKVTNRCTHTIFVTYCYDLGSNLAFDCAVPTHRGGMMLDAGKSDIASESGTLSAVSQLITMACPFPQSFIVNQQWIGNTVNYACRKS